MNKGASLFRSGKSLYTELPFHKSEDICSDKVKNLFVEIFYNGLLSALKVSKVLSE